MGSRVLIIMKRTLKAGETMTNKGMFEYIGYSGNDSDLQKILTRCAHKICSKRPINVERIKMAVTCLSGATS